MSEGTRPQAAPGTIVVYTDIVCAWSTVTLHRLTRARLEAGLEDAVRFDLRLFPLEVVNAFPIPRRFLDSEIPVVGQLAEDFGWAVWQADPSTWPVTSLPANEAVHAAKAQSLRASEQLDMALRHAFFSDSRCIAMRHEILDVAGSCPDVDADELADALDDGRARGPMMADFRRHGAAVQGSPHLFLADGYDVHNPGVEQRWAGGEEGKGFPVVVRDEPEACAEVIRRAAAVASV